MLSETLKYINSKIGEKFTKELYDTLKDEFTSYCLSKNEIDLSVNLILKYNGTLSLADCLTLVIMEKL